MVYQCYIVFKNDILQTYVVRYASPPNKSIIPAAGRLFQRPDDCSSGRITVSAAERLLRHTIPADEYSHELWPRSPPDILMRKRASWNCLKVALGKKEQIILLEK